MEIKNIKDYDFFLAYVILFLFKHKVPFQNRNALPKQEKNTFQEAN